jgi:hypothetical protein
MARLMNDKVIPHDPPPFRFCTNHNEFVRADGGNFLVFNKGKNRRWICKLCIERRKQRDN